MKFGHYDKLVKRIAKHILTNADEHSIISWDAYVSFFYKLKEDVEHELYKKPNKGDL